MQCCSAAWQQQADRDWIQLTQVLLLSEGAGRGAARPLGAGRGRAVQHLQHQGLRHPGLEQPHHHQHTQVCC